MNMLQTIVPKSDQLNADDLIGQSMSIKVTEVRFKAGDDQPVSIHFDGDNGKPYKPCKSMRRVLVHAWGADANKYLGRSMSLVRDPKVQWGGQAVGGIRITHLSHIDSPLTMALTATRGSRKPYTVEVLALTPTDEPKPEKKQPPSKADYDNCQDLDILAKLEERRIATWKQVPTAEKPVLKAASLLATLRTAPSKDALEKAWSETCDWCTKTDLDIPDAHQAAYAERGAALGETGQQS